MILAALAASRDRHRSERRHPFRQSGRRTVFRVRRRRAVRQRARRSRGAAQPAAVAGRLGMADRQHDFRVRHAARRAAVRRPLGHHPGGADRRGCGHARAHTARALDGGNDGPPPDPPERRALDHRRWRRCSRTRSRTRFPGSAARRSCSSRMPIRRARADPADLRRDRPHRRAGRSHGSVLRSPPDRARSGQHPSRCSSGCARPRNPVSRATSGCVEEYDPSLPPVHGNRDLLVQVFLNLVKNAAEAVPNADGEIILTTAYRHGLRLTRPGGEGRQHLPLMVCGDRQRRPASRRICAPISSSRSSRPSGTALASVLHWSPR